MCDPYRPFLHFTPRKGWMNDPNGLIRVDGVWHMFFQLNPGGITHGDIHWGHARSHDLMTWEELPVALAPDALGQCFSGSAVQTATGEVKLIYTAHSKAPDGSDFEQQCLVHADAGMISFYRDSQNPVLPNPDGRPVFRDPKVIWHDQSSQWIMLVTEGQSVGFYASADLTDWRFLSSFGETDIAFRGGVWECPDLIAFPDGQFVLTVGVQSGAYAPGSGTMYFIGHFDGFRFTNANPPDLTLWMDYGRDFYAAQSFFDRTGEIPVALAWAGNWDYARKTPATVYRGAMTLPRLLSLVETAEGSRLRQTLPEALSAALRAGSMDSGTTSTTLHLDLRPGDQQGIRLFDEDAPHFILHRTSQTKALLHCRRSDHPAMPGFGHAYAVPLDWPDVGPMILDLHIDRGLVELSTAGGETWVTTQHFPANPAGTLRQSRSLQHHEAPHG